MSYIVTTPDVCGVLLARAQAFPRLAKWGLFVAREKPASTSRRVLTISDAGGPEGQAGMTGPGLLDDVRVAINVYGVAGDAGKTVADIARDVRSFIEAQNGIAPFHTVRAAGAAPIDSDGEPPQRYFIANLLTRRETP